MISLMKQQTASNLPLDMWDKMNERFYDQFLKLNVWLPCDYSVNKLRRNAVQLTCNHIKKIFA